MSGHQSRNLLSKQFSSEKSTEVLKRQAKKSRKQSASHLSDKSPSAHKSMLFGGTGKLNPESSQDFNYLNEEQDVGGNQMMLELDPVYIKKMLVNQKQKSPGGRQEVLHYQHRLQQHQTETIMHSQRSSRSVPVHMFNRFEVRKHVFDLYNDYMVQKDRMGEDPCQTSEDEMPQYNKSPSKDAKQQILSAQLADRQSKEAEKKRSKTLVAKKKQMELKTLEQRYMEDLQLHRKRQTMSLGKSLKNSKSHQNDLLEQLQVNKEDESGKKRKRKSKKAKYQTQRAKSNAVHDALFEQRKTSERLTDLRIWIEDTLRKDGVEPILNSPPLSNKSGGAKSGGQSKKPNRQQDNIFSMPRQSIDLDVVIEAPGNSELSIDQAAIAKQRRKRIQSQHQHDELSKSPPTFDHLHVRDQQRNFNQSAPSDTEIILKDLVSPQGQDQLQQQVQNLSRKERKEAKKVLVTALTGLINKLDVSDSQISSDQQNSSMQQKKARRSRGSRHQVQLREEPQLREEQNDARQNHIEIDAKRRAYQIQQAHQAQYEEQQNHLQSQEQQQYEQRQMQMQYHIQQQQQQQLAMENQAQAYRNQQQRRRRRTPQGNHSDVVADPEEIRARHRQPRYDRNRVQVNVPVQQPVVSEIPPGVVYMRHSQDMFDSRTMDTPSLQALGPEEPVQRLQDSFSMQVNDSSIKSGKKIRQKNQGMQKIKTSELRRSQRFSNYLHSTLNSEQTDASEQAHNPMFQGSVSASSVGDFSRVMGSSLTLSRTTMPHLDSSIQNRGTIHSGRDPLSMINAYAQKNSSKTPDPRLTVARLEDDDEPDFQRDEAAEQIISPSWQRSHKSQSKKVRARLSKIEEEPEHDYQQKTRHNIAVDNTVVDTSQIQLIDFVSDQPVEITPQRKDSPMRFSDLEQQTIKENDKNTIGDLENQQMQLQATPSQITCYFRACTEPAFDQGKTKCSYSIRLCGQGGAGGCKKAFCENHRAKDAKRDMPDICQSCKNDFLATKKRVSCIFMAILFLSVLLVAGLMFTVLFLANHEEEVE